MSEPSEKSLDLHGRVAIVTGAGRGLGRAYALALACRGAAVVVNDVGGGVDGLPSRKDEDPAGQVVDEIEALGGTALASYADVSDSNQAQSIIDDALGRFGRVDIVVANAGIVRRAGFGESTEQELDTMLAVHLRGTYGVCRAAWPHMVAQKHGRIVTVISSALYGIGGSATYAAAKGGTLGLSKVMAMEGAEFNIKVNMVAPVAYTRMTASGRASGLVRPDDPGLSPDGAASLVTVLAHESCPCTAEMFLASGRRVARVFLGESDGYSSTKELTPESVMNNWDQVMAANPFTIPTGRLEGVMSSVATNAADQDEAKRRDRREPQ